MDKVHAFYASKPWRDLAFALKVAAGGRCSDCGRIIEDMGKLIGHHVVELTEDNVDDPNISLNPDKIEIICFDCHNKRHRRFGHKQGVYIVWGSPMAGKTTAVRQMMRYGDLIVDVDELWRAVTMQDLYIKPDNVRFNVFAVRDALYDQIKMRYGQWYDAYVIGGFPEKYERERTAEMLGAELIYCESTRDECLQRVADGGKPEAWKKYISAWWDTFERYGA